jgi:antitoxin component of MazEF toxin-antitoxin module
MRSAKQSQATIGRWGKNLAVRFPADVAKAAGFGDGERVEVLTQKGQVIIRRVAPSFTAEGMFRGKQPEEWRALYKEAYDWGADRGREIVEE